MTGGGKKGAMLFFAFLMASVVLQATLASAQTSGIVRVDSDIEMFGVSDLSGGGHFTVTLTGDLAIQLRQRILMVYDENEQVPPGFPFEFQATQGNQDGNIDAAEVLTYAQHVENYIEGFTSAEEQYFHYARLKATDVLEDDTIQGIQLSTEGLIGVPPVGPQSAVMKFIFEAGSSAKERPYYLADPVFVKAIFFPFEYDVFKSFEDMSDIFLSLVPENFTTQGSWETTDIEPGPNSPSSFWVGGDASNRTYLPNATQVTYADLDLRLAEAANLSFYYKGDAASGDQMVLEVRPAGGSWQLLDTFTAADSENQWTYREYDLTPYAGEKVRVRFNFTSDATNEATGFFIDEFSVKASAAYAGDVAQSHTDYLVGVMSFSDFVLRGGTAHYIRTPGGVILTQSIQYAIDDPPTDSITYSSFDFFENPQILFILIVVGGYVLSYMQNRFYYYYKGSHPSRYRGRAVKIRWLHLLGLLFIILFVLFYFFPSLLVLAGPKLYLTGIFMWVFVITATVVLSVASKVVYDRAISRIPPPPEEARREAVRPGIAGVAAPVAPPPPPVATLTCSVCSQDIDDRRSSVRCACGHSYHPHCAVEVSNCPNCGRALPVGPPKPKKMISVKCPACGELGLVEEDADLARTKCEACGIILKEVETGYNYLIIDDHPAMAYEQFKSILGRNIPGLCFSTVFPEKLEREYGLEGADLYWISDTSTEHKAVDPKRLDFELMRALGNFVKTYPGSVVMLDGLEYLVVENGFDRVLKFIKKVNDLASVNDCTLFVPITPTSLGGDEISMLRKEFDRVQSFVS
jgi:ribosomal protein S27E